MCKKRLENSETPTLDCLSSYNYCHLLFTDPTRKVFLRSLDIISGKLTLLPL